MDHSDLYLLRETYNKKCLLLCFNGPFSQGIIEELGVALKNYLHSEAAPSSAFDVFGAYIELTQNIRSYCVKRGYDERDASATVVIGRENGHYILLAGNIVEPEDGRALQRRVTELALLDKSALRAAYKEQLRRPRGEETEDGAGLGLIDIARKASAPFSCSLSPTNAGTKMFFSLRVVI